MHPHRAPPPGGDESRGGVRRHAAGGGKSGFRALTGQMSSATAFVDIPRSRLPKRPASLRIKDWREVEGDLAPGALREQAARCIDCGIPFCHKGCPLGNHIPDWNDLVSRSRWRQASDRLHATNNFPEFTGRICPAPCEEACVLNISGDPVTIRQIEKQIVDHAWREGWLAPQPCDTATGCGVAVVGSGPAGLAAAQQLARVGHAVTVFERDDRPGGLLRYGIPDFKMEKAAIDRRLDQMRAEGVVFRTGVNIGPDIGLDALGERFDAVVLAIGAQAPRALDIPGRDLHGVHFAMEYLTRQNRRVAGDRVADPISAADRHVVILGGGDTGADCLGTAHRHGAREVQHFHYKPPPPAERTAEMPWPWWPMILRESSSHEEGGHREWSAVPKRFSGDASGRVRRMHCVRVRWEADAGGVARMIEIPGTGFAVRADLVLLSIGFTGPETGVFGAQAPRRRDDGTIAVGSAYETSRPGVFACGDATRGASLVVWAIWEGREAARAVDVSLRGASPLPTLPNRFPI